MARQILEFEMRFHAQYLLIALLFLSSSPGLGSDAEVFLALEEAPTTVFPDADQIERFDIKSDDPMRERMKALIGRLQPSLWEPYYITFVARRGGEPIGYAVVCEEIGKHRPMTFIVATDTAGHVRDVALMAYRERIGAEVRYKGFVRQFDDKTLDNPIHPRRDIRNISGATLSVRAMSRGVRKALAVLDVAYFHSGRLNKEPTE